MACDIHLGNKSLINAEYERKKELERRRILRLLQVRQQSKDFADRLRESIKAETLNKRNAILKLKRKQVQEQQLEEINLLRDIYGMCLKDVGTSHREAANQPDINLLKELEAAQKSSEAALRGAKARKKQQDEKFLEEQKIHAPIEQKLKTRNRENVRSFFISCLPKQTTAGLQKKHSRSPKKVPPNKVSKSNRSLNVLKEVPSNVTVPEPIEISCSGLNKDVIKSRLPKNTSEGFVEEVCKQTCDEVGESTKNINKDDNSSSEPLNKCSCDYLVCPCHSKGKGIRRRCYSESTVSSDHTLESNKQKIRTRSCSPQTVRTLNYCSIGNVYESKEQNFTKVKHHPKTSLPNLECLNSKTADELTSENIPKNKESIKKTEERGLKALQREQLKKDFQQLLQDLKKVNCQKLAAKNKKKSKSGVYQRERDILTKRENKQKKLADAFESLLQTIKCSPQKNRDFRTDMYWPPLEPSSPPTLNLATYQPSKSTTPRHLPRVRRELSTDKVERSDTPHEPQMCSRLFGSPEQTRPISREQHYGLYPVEEQYSAEGQCSRDEQQQFREEKSSGSGHYTKRRHRPLNNVHSEKNSIPLILCNEDKLQSSEISQPSERVQAPERSPESGTSYYSLPDHLTPSQKQLLDALSAQVKTKRLNKNLKLYIQKLLSMSRESIEDLPTSPSLDVARSRQSSDDDESMRKLTELFNIYTDRLNQLVSSIEEMDNCASPVQLLDLPRDIAPDVFRNPPSPPALLKSKPLSPSSTPVQQERSISPRPHNEPSQIPVSSQYRKTPSPGLSHSPTQQPHSGRSPPRQPASEIRGVQTAFGLPSNLMPNPKDYYRQATTSCQSQDQHNMQSSLNKSDDSTAWAIDGLPTPPDRPPGASPIDDDKLFMERFGYLPDEECSELNLSAEVKKLLANKPDIFRLSGDEDQHRDHFGVSENFDRDPQAEDDNNQAEFYGEDFEGNVQYLDFLRSHLQS